MNSSQVTIIGGGLAGCEAAWQLLRRGISVDLMEMKPAAFSPAHRSPYLAELVCSNSLRSEIPESAVGLLKKEMTLLDSLIMEAAAATRVPAGKALAVDRTLFSLFIEKRLLSQHNFRLLRGEVSHIPDDRICIIATGPLTSEVLVETISDITDGEHLYFYDAISPVIDASSIDLTVAFRASRYQEGEGDYLNCPLTKAQYEQFHWEILNGRETPLREFEDKKCFEGCLPIEVMARRGIDTLRFGPMKPVGLIDPATGAQPYAVLQLRQENIEATLYNMVGFQTKLARHEQQRIFRMISGLEEAEFARFGSIHRNTFLNAPALLSKSLQLKKRASLFFAGQITGVEGYLESSAMGLWSGISVYRHLSGMPSIPPPRTTAIGALVNHITESSIKYFQPMNVNFGLFPPLEKRFPKKERGARYAERACADLTAWKRESMN